MILKSNDKNIKSHQKNLSFRHQVYITPNKNTFIPESMLISYDNTQIPYFPLRR